MAGLIPFLLQALAVTVWLLFLGRVLMSWIDPTFSRPLGQFVYSLTEPILEPIRRVLPRAGSLDLSPLVVLLVMSVVIRVVVAL